MHTHACRNTHKHAPPPRPRPCFSNVKTVQEKSRLCLGIRDELVILEFKSWVSMPRVLHKYFGELGSPCVFHAPTPAPQTADGLHLNVNVI